MGTIQLLVQNRGDGVSVSARLVHNVQERMLTGSINGWARDWLLERRPSESEREVFRRALECVLAELRDRDD